MGRVSGEMTEEDDQPIREEDGVVETPEGLEGTGDRPDVEVSDE